MNVALEDPVICHIRFRSWLFKVGHFPVERSNLWKTHRKAWGGKWYFAYFTNVYWKLHMVSTLHQKQFSFINYYFSHLVYNLQWQWSNHGFLNSFYYITVITSFPWNHENYSINYYIGNLYLVKMVKYPPRWCQCSIIFCHRTSWNQSKLWCKSCWSFNQ